jgi:hypothetical protein
MAIVGEEFLPGVLEGPTPAAKGIGIIRNDYPILLLLRFV